MVEVIHYYAKSLQRERKLWKSWMKLDKSKHKLLDQALSSKALPQGKRKVESDENLVRRRKVTKHCSQYCVTCYRCGT